MSRETVPHVAVVLHVQGDDDLTRRAAYWTEACNVQIREHLAPAWGIEKPPGVFFYGTAAGIPEDASAVVGIFANGDVADAAGYHTLSGDLVFGVVDLSRSSSPSRTLSHEVAELTLNPWLDFWLQGPQIGREYAGESSDPVQRISYHVKASILGQSRDVEVGDFVTPAWFGLKALGTALNWCDTIRKPFEVAPGGYQIAREGDSILYLPARGEGVSAASVSRKGSRTKRITEGDVVARKEFT
jgi:hypothetical protein